MKRHVVGYVLTAIMSVAATLSGVALLSEGHQHPVHQPVQSGIESFDSNTEARDKFMNSLDFTFVDKKVSELSDGEAGWTTAWQVNGTAESATIDPTLSLEKVGEHGTVHTLVGKKNGVITATVFNPPANCGRDYSLGFDQEPSDANDVPVQFIVKDGPCPYVNVQGHIAPN